MNPYLHEFRHLLTRRAVLGAVIVALLAGLVLYSPVYLAENTISIVGAGFAFEENGNVTVEIWDYDSAGVAVPGVHVQLNVTGCPQNQYCQPVTLLLVQRAVSDSNGFSKFTFASPPPPTGVNASLSVTVSASYPPATEPSMSGALSTGFGLPLDRNGNLTLLYGPITPVLKSYYDSQEGPSVVTWAGPLGVSPAGDRVIECVTFGSVNKFGYNYTQPQNCTGAAWTSTVGTLTGPETRLPTAAIPPTDLIDRPFMIQFEEIVNRTGVALYVGGGGQAPCYVCTPFGGPPQPGGPVVFNGATISGVGPGILEEFGVAMALFGPVMGLMLAYWGYARPRLSGTLESTLVRPVTRRGLFLTRYLAVSVTLAVISIAEVLILDAELTGALREPLPGGDLAALTGGLLVATIGVAGIVFLLAHVFRSPGPVLGIGIAVMIVFGLLWTVLIVLIEVFVVAPQLDATTPMWTVWADLIAPGQYVNNAVYLEIDQSPLNSGTFGWAGITGIDLIVAGLAWILLPFVGSYWLAQWRE